VIDAPSSRFGVSLLEIVAAGSERAA